MSRSFLPLMTILPEAQKLLWPALKPTRSLGFVLYGGTAIALRLGHRLSIDFDFFNDKPLDKEKIRTAFPFMSQAIVLQDETETLTVLIKDIDGRGDYFTSKTESFLSNPCSKLLPPSTRGYKSF